MAVHIACYRDAVSCCIRAEFKENIAVFALLILRKHRRRLSISTFRKTTLSKFNESSNHNAFFKYILNDLLKMFKCAN